jgi:hypothetical protein
VSSTSSGRSFGVLSSASVERLQFLQRPLRTPGEKGAVAVWKVCLPDSAMKAESLFLLVVEEEEVEEE